MAHYQHVLLDWVASQSGLTGAVIMSAGFLSAFFGFRMLRFLLALYCGGLGYAAGLAAATLAELPPLAALVGGLMGAVAAVAWPITALVIASGATWACLGGYLAGQVGLPSLFTWTAVGLAGGTGTLMAILCRRAMTILLTSVLGSALIIVGFVGLAATVLPSVSATFRSWAAGQSLMVPTLMTMLVTTGYSCQANAWQGDIRSGSQSGLSRSLRRRSSAARGRDLC